MLIRNGIIAVLLAAIIPGLVIANPASAQLSCSDVKYGNPNYHENMDKLAEQARLPDNYWNRYHESVVSDLCSGNIKGIDTFINDRFVKLREAQEIARVLGKSYKPKHAISSSPAAPPQVLSDLSYGPITFGAQLKNIEKQLGEKATADNNDKECDFVRFKKLPGIYFMVENGIVTRADTTSPQIKNTLLISIGTPLNEIKRRYPKVEIEPQKYLKNGHYLIFKSQDGKRAIIFDEDGGKVTGVRAGVEPSVEYVEGCQ